MDDDNPYAPPAAETDTPQPTVDAGVDRDTANFTIVAISAFAIGAFGAFMRAPGARRPVSADDFVVLAVSLAAVILANICLIGSRRDITISGRSPAVTSWLILAVNVLVVVAAVPTCAFARDYLTHGHLLQASFAVPILAALLIALLTRNTPGKSTGRRWAIAAVATGLHVFIALVVDRSHVIWE